MERDWEAPASSPAPPMGRSPISEVHIGKDSNGDSSSPQPLNPLPIITPQNPIRLSIFNQSSSSPQPLNSLPIPTRRKLLTVSILLSSSSIAQFCRSTWAETENLLDLDRYTDSNQGFTLLRPKSWIKVKKARATLLFEDPSKGSNNVGVVVTPFRLITLREFGDPQFEDRMKDDDGGGAVAWREKFGSGVTESSYLHLIVMISSAVVDGGDFYSGGRRWRFLRRW